MEIFFSFGKLVALVYVIQATKASSNLIDETGPLLLFCLMQTFIGRICAVMPSALCIQPQQQRRQWQAHTFPSHPIVTNVVPHIKPLSQWIDFGIGNKRTRPATSSYPHFLCRRRRPVAGAKSNIWRSLLSKDHSLYFIFRPCVVNNVHCLFTCEWLKWRIGTRTHDFRRSAFFRHRIADTYICHIL